MTLNTNEIIKELYYTKPVSFLKDYGSQLVLSILIIFIFMVIITYVQFKNAVPELKKNWDKKRCNPVYMPFAGLVSKNKGETNIDAVQRNFNNCVNNILHSIAEDALTPIHYTVNLIGEAIKSIEDAFSAIRSTIDKTRSSITNISEDMSGRTLNIMIPLQKMFIYSKDFLAKVKAIYTTGIFTLIGSYLITKSVIFNIINIIIVTILLVLVASIVAYLLIPYVGQVLAAPLMITVTAIAFVLMPVIINFDNQMGGDVSDVLPHW